MTLTFITSNTQISTIVFSQLVYFNEDPYKAHKLHLVIFLKSLDLEWLEVSFDHNLTSLSIKYY